MAAPKRADVDWQRIYNLYQEGYGPYAIRQTLAEEGISISKQAIMQRRDREGWKAPDGTQRPLPPKRPRTTVKPAAAAPADTAAVAPAAPAEASHQPPAKAAGMDVSAELSEVKKQIIQAVAKNGLREASALAAGVTSATYKAWLDSDPIFAEQVKQAGAIFASGRIDNIVAAGDRGEWRADSELLKIHPETRTDFGDPSKSGGNGGLVVNFNFELKRGDKPAEADIITIEQDTGG